MKTGNYYVESIGMTDVAGVGTDIIFVECPKHEQSKPDCLDHEPRISIYIETANPDYNAPELDLNRIVVYAEPTNKEAPNGETLVTIHYYARDDKSGLGFVWYNLKGPQGTGYFNYHYHENFYSMYYIGEPTVWTRYTITTVLPEGTAPGIWGLADLTLYDKACNGGTYNFVETLIFEPDESTTDYILFSEMTDNENLLIQLSSELDAGYGFTYRIIHEDSGYEISGEQPTQSTRAASHSRSEYVDVSSLPDGKLIVIVSVKDNKGDVLAVRSNTLVKGKFRLSYMVDGVEHFTDSLNYGETIVLKEEPTKEGHTFSGWSEVPETMPANDVVISGTFTINKYLVTFKIDEEVIAADSLEYGTAIIAPEAPEKEGHTFNGWGEVAETVPAGDVTYEGTYTVNIYKVYYYVGEELVHTAEVAYGEAIPEYVYEPTEDGYTFLGWVGKTYTTMPAHDVTYTANIDDGIGQLIMDSAQLTIYDLMGRKVTDTENLKGGIYIVNGRKVVIK